MQRGAVFQGQLQAAVPLARVDRQQVGAGTLLRLTGADRLLGKAVQQGAAQYARGAAEEVETDLRLGPGHFSPLRMPLAQQAKPCAPAGDRPQLFLHRQQLGARLRLRRQLQPQREEAGEPAHAAGEIHLCVGKEFFPSVALQI